MSQLEPRIRLRSMTTADVDAVLAIQEPGAIAGLGAVFPQDKFPFPRELIASRWAEEIAAGIDCLVVDDPNGAIVGFAAVRLDEFMHFGVALDVWGSGVAQLAHDAVLARMRSGGVERAWLRVFAGNARARRFYERLGWSEAGEVTRSGFPPYAELLRYERDLTPSPVRE